MAVGLVVLGGTFAGALVAVLLPDAAPSDADVVSAIAVRADVDRSTAGCALGRLVAGDGLHDDLRRRLVDATDPLDDVPIVDETVAACASITTTSTTAAPGPLPECTGSSGADPAAVEVCAVTALVDVLRAGSDIDAATATCAAEAVVDALGVSAVLDALGGGALPPDLRDRIREAFAAC